MPGPSDEEKDQEKVAEGFADWLHHRVDAEDGAGESHAAVRPHKPPHLHREESLGRLPRMPHLHRDESLSHLPRKRRVSWSILTAREGSAGTPSEAWYVQPCWTLYLLISKLQSCGLYHPMNRWLLSPGRPCLGNAPTRTFSKSGSCVWCRRLRSCPM